MLSQKEKKEIIESLIKNLESTKFQIEKELEAELSLDSYSNDWVVATNKQISDLSDKINYLELIINDFI